MHNGSHFVLDASWLGDHCMDSDEDVVRVKFALIGILAIPIDNTCYTH